LPSSCCTTRTVPPRSPAAPDAAFGSTLAPLGAGGPITAGCGAGGTEERVADAVTATIGDSTGPACVLEVSEAGPGPGGRADASAQECQRYEGMGTCGGCAVLRVAGGVAVADCESYPGAGDDLLLASDERASALRTAAAASLLAAAGVPDAGGPGVTVTVTSCGRLDLLDATLESLWRALGGDTPIVRVVVVEDSGDPAACAAVRLRHAGAPAYPGAEQDGPTSGAAAAGIPVDVLCNSERLGQASEPSPAAPRDGGS